MSGLLAILEAQADAEIAADKTRYHKTERPP